MTLGLFLDHFEATLGSFWGSTKNQILGPVKKTVFPGLSKTYLFNDTKGSPQTTHKKLAYPSNWVDQACQMP